MLYSSANQSWIHRVNPVTKLSLMMTGIIVILFVHNINIMFSLTAAFILLVFAGSGQTKSRILLFMLPFLFVFVSTSTSMIFFGKGSTLWWQWGPVHITRESFYRGVHVGLRALCFGLMGLLFALTTRPVYLFYSLMQQAGVPPKYAYGFMASARLLPLIAGEFKTLRQAYKVRGVQVSKNVSGLMQTLHLYAIPLLAQSIRRARRIAVAMEARRFNNQSKRTYYYQMGFSNYDTLMVLCWLAIFFGSWMLGVNYPMVSIQDIRF